VPQTTRVLKKKEDPNTHASQFINILVWQFVIHSCRIIFPADGINLFASECYNPPQLISRFARPNLREPKCSK
jgi:hypothetical protein